MPQTPAFFDDAPRERSRRRAGGVPTPAKPARAPRQTVNKEFEKRAAAMAYTLQPPSAEETAFRHSAWTTRRNVVRGRLQSAGASTWELDRWDCCGSDCVVEYSAQLKRHRLRANYCHCRHCEPCMRSKSNKIAANLRSRLGAGKSKEFRFFTFTLRHTSTPLRDQVKRLFASFKKVRSNKLWKKSQRGGAMLLEVKWNPETREWHPHLHVIAQGSWLAGRELSVLWEQVTLDSKIVDVRAIDSGKDVAHYVAKYVTKGTNAAVWADADASQEWIIAMKGVRVCDTFGSWRGFGLLKVTARASDWTPIGTLNRVMSESRAGVSWAMSVLLSLRPPGREDEARREAGQLPPPAPSAVATDI
jgi:hypothetical protein